MTDYIIKFSGQDNLSGTINNIKSELKDVGKSTTALDEITKKFQRIQNSSAPLKKKLRDLQTMMAQMNLDGLDKSDVFTQISAQAGAYKDAISDAAEATRLLSSDTAKLDAGVQALQGLAGAASVATGLMGLLGSKNEEVQQSILKVQSALGILNGIQGVANVLNKNSILMLTIKQAQARAAATAVTLESNATKGATVAQAAFNLVAKANPYVLLASVAIAAGAAIYAFTKKTDDAAQAQKELEEQAESYKEAQDSQNNTLAESIVKFKELQNRWNSLGNDLNAKKRFVDDNSTAFGNLGIKVNDVTDAEKVFGKNANAIIAAMRARARAAAAHAMMVKNLTQVYQQLSEVEAKIKKGESFSKSELANIGILNPDAMAGLRSEFTFSSLFGGEETYTVIGRGAANQIMDAATATLEARADELNKPFEQMADKAQAEADKVPFFTSSGSSGKSNRSTGRSGSKNTTITSNPEPVFKADAITLEDMQNNVTILKNQLKTLDVNSDKFKEVSKEIERWETLIKNAGKSWKDMISPDSLKPSLDGFTKELPKIKDLSLNIRMPDHYELLKKQQEGLLAIVDAARQASEAFSSLGSAIGGTAGVAIGAFGSIAATIAQTIGQVVSLMIANGVSSAMSLPFPANLVAAATVMAGLASIIATIKNAASGNFAEGGIVGGSSLVGDRLIAHVNSGEMILNGRQQRNLFNLLDHGGSPSGSGGLVEFKISGSTLKGVLRNYDNKMSKIK